MSNPINKTDKLITGITKLIGAAALCALAVWGIWYVWNLLHYEQTNDAQVEEYVNPINTKVGGYIKKVCFKENQYVNAGDTLAIIDNSEYRVQHEESAAALEQARSQINILDAGINTLRHSADMNKSQIDAAKAKMTRQQQEYKRIGNLIAEESATQQKFEDTKAALDIATAEYQTTLQAYETAIARIADAEAQKAAAIAEVKKKEAVLHKSDLDLDYTVITAPYKGRLGKKVIQQGQLVQPGQALVFIINDEAGKWVIANFKETQVGRMAPGQIVKVVVDAFPEETYLGEIESWSPATGSRYSLMPPDNATGNFVKIIQRIPVRIRLTGNNNNIARLAAGMNASVFINK